MTRARHGLVLAYAVSSRRRSDRAPRRCSSRRAPRCAATGSPATRSCRAGGGAALDLPRAPRRAARDRRAARHAPRGAALRHRPRHRPRRRALRRAGQAGLAAPAPRRRARRRRPRTSTPACQRRSRRCSRSCSRARRWTSCCSARPTTRVPAPRRWRPREPTLEAFLPRRGEGLVLSASDVESDRSCPRLQLRARAADPREPTLNERFGILVHQVLDLHHRRGQPRGDDAVAGGRLAPRRLSDSDEERDCARRPGCTDRYHERLGEGDAEPRRFERSFDFALGGTTSAAGSTASTRCPAGLRADRLQDRRPQARRAASRRRAARALRGRRPRGLADRATERSYYYVLDDVRFASARPTAHPRGSRRPSRRWPTGSWRRPSTDPVTCGLLDVRVPDRLPAAEKYSRCRSAWCMHQAGDGACTVPAIGACADRHSRLNPVPSSRAGGFRRR